MKRISHTSYSSPQKKRTLNIGFFIAIALVLAIGICAIRYYHGPQRRIDAAAKDLDAAYAPVDLTSLTPYFEGVIDVFTDGIRDTMGNTYRTGMRGYMSTSDSSRFDCFHIWDIGCQYNTLTATGIIREEDKGSRCEGCYRIYGDGILLYERSNIGSTTKPYSIEVDITGVTDLKIEMYGEGNMGTGGMDSVLVDVMLHKK